MVTTCGKTKWKGRPAVKLSNGAIELIALTGGGTIADLRMTSRRELVQNVLWESPWPSLDPDRYNPPIHNRTYGPEFVGKFLAGFTGHVLALDYFGAPSKAEAREGLCLHGEASVNRWKVLRESQSRSSSAITMEVLLPQAGLKFQRELRMRRNETVVYVSESVSNLQSTDHFFQWTQHVTLGPPFLKSGESVVCIPAERAITWPHGYEGRSLLGDAKQFKWPHAPAAGEGNDGTSVDISRPFSRAGTGFVAGALLQVGREWGFVAALNTRLGLLLGYCFPRAFFPWVAVWEENCARQNSPWMGKTQARGMEFGTSPMPVGKQEAMRTGPIFGQPTFGCVSAKAKVHTGYLIFLAGVNPGWTGIRDVEVGKQVITVVSVNGEKVTVPARDLKKMGAS